MAHSTPHQSALASKSVAIIGGGVAGLMCAVKLRQLGLTDVTVFDTGKNAVGGRMSSRDVAVPSPSGRVVPLRLEHSAQLLAATTPRFQKMLDHWESLGLVAQYSPGAVGTLHAASGQFVPRPADLPPCYFAPQGMRSLALRLAENLRVEAPVWVGRAERRHTGTAGGVEWDVFGERRKHLGAYSYLVIAHNGKCADRLMSTADAPAVHALLRTKFTATPTPQQVMQLCSLWVATVVLPTPLQLPYAAAFVAGDPDLSFISNTSAKLAAHTAAAPLEAWTLISSREFGAANKVPQEAIPPQKDREVKAALLDAFSRVTRLPRAQLAPVFERVQLWGAAVPLNVTNAPCVLDTETACGVCGDWLVAPSVEGAALSGVSLAEHIVAHATGQLSGSVGLGVRFAVTQSAPLGAVPTPLPAVPPRPADGQQLQPARRERPPRGQRRGGRGGAPRPGSRAGEATAARQSRQAVSGTPQG